MSRYFCKKKGEVVLKAKAFKVCMIRKCPELQVKKGVLRKKGGRRRRGK